MLFYVHIFYLFFKIKNPRIQHHLIIYFPSYYLGQVGNKVTLYCFQEAATCNLYNSLKVMCVVQEYNYIQRTLLV